MRMGCQVTAVESGLCAALLACVTCDWREGTPQGAGGEEEDWELACTALTLLRDTIATATVTATVTEAGGASRAQAGRHRILGPGGGETLVRFLASHRCTRVSPSPLKRGLLVLLVRLLLCP